MKNLFIQFYTKIPDYYILSNGFSQTYYYCKSIGEIIWLDEDTNIKNYKFPINEGNVYVSCVTFKHLYTAILMGKYNQNLKFIIGGPACSMQFKIIDELPKNVTITNKRVEEFFGIKNFESKWHLEIPEHIKDNEKIYFTYALDNNLCYWKKCIFCVDTISENILINRKNISHEFEKVNHKGIKIIRLSTSCISKESLKQLRNPAKDTYYRIFMRASNYELKVLKGIKNFNNLNNISLSIGAEFPTNRMWKYMKKGYDEESFINFIDYTKRHSIKFSFILGWPNLEYEDVTNLKNFLNRMPKITNDPSFSLHNLFAYYKTEAHNTLESKEKITIGPFYIGFKPFLSKEKIEINNRANDVLHEYCEKNNIYISDSTK